MTDTSTLHTAFDALLQDAVPRELKEKGWVYRDFPRTSPDIWKGIIAAMGPAEDWQALALATYPDGKQRGQFFLSPAALDRILVWLRTKMP